MITRKFKLISKNEVNGEKVVMQFAENLQIDKSNPQQPRQVASNVVTVNLSGEDIELSNQFKTGTEYRITFE